MWIMLGEFLIPNKTSPTVPVSLITVLQITGYKLKGEVCFWSLLGLQEYYTSVELNWTLFITEDYKIHLFICCILIYALVYKVPYQVLKLTRRAVLMLLHNSTPLGFCKFGAHCKYSHANPELLSAAQGK